MQRVTRPFFSIIIPTLNEGRHLPLLLGDLVKQSMDNFEVVIVDAKSEDNTFDSAKVFENKFKKLKILQSTKKSVSYQRNFGAKRTNSEWLIFMDADNRLPTNFLQLISDYLLAQDVDILSSWILPDGSDIVSKISVALTNLYLEVQKQLKQDFLLESFICIKKAAFQRLNGFNPNTLWGEGGELLKRAYQMGLKFNLTKTPRYVYSLRRVRKFGFLKVFGVNFIKEFHRFCGIEISKKTSNRLYPMKGGKYYN